MGYLHVNQPSSQTVFTDFNPSFLPPPLNINKVHITKQESSPTRADDATLPYATTTNNNVSYFSTLRSSLRNARASMSSQESDYSRRESDSTRFEKRDSAVQRLDSTTSRDYHAKSSLSRQASSSPEPEAVPSIRIASFHGIDMDIPGGELGDLLDANNFEFSRTGSILKGQRPSRLAAAPTHERTIREQPSQEVMPQPAVFETPVLPEQQQDTPLVAKSGNGSPKRLQGGRRKPSAHRLEAMVNAGRILSMEENAISVRLRSMYDYGDENAAEAVEAPTPSIRPVTPDTRESMESDRPTTPKDHGDLAVPKNRGQPGFNGRIQPSSRRSSKPRGPSEAAGGIEDYEDIPHSDVDRYGFIIPSSSRTSDASAPSPSKSLPALPVRAGLQRVSNPLQFLSNGPRRHRSAARATSRENSRSSQSVPAQPQKTRSLRSQGSRLNFRAPSSGAFERTFLTGDRRLVDSAGDMLSAPPGLEAIAETSTDGQSQAARRREASRVEKWRSMATPQPSRGGGGTTFTFNTSDPLLISRTWKGVPDSWRATAWHSFMTSSMHRRGIGAPDAELISEYHALQRLNCADDVQIDVDVPRTINLHVMFRRRYRGGQRLLYRVLHALALKFPDIGYVQGMGAVASTLLCYFDEEMAFVMLVRLWELRGLSQLYGHGFGGLMAALKQFDTEWLAEGHADVKSSLDKLGIDGTAYGTRWYLTLFNMSMPFAAQLRIWDVFMLLGDADLHSAAPSLGAGADASFEGADLDVLHAASTALMDASKTMLLNADFEIAMKVLTSWVPVKDEDLLMRVAQVEWKAKKKRDETRSRTA